MASFSDTAFSTSAFSPSAFDLSAADLPAVLSNILLEATSTTTVFIDYTTNTGSGIIYWYATTSITPPSIADLKAGVGAEEFGNHVVFEPAGPKGFNIVALTPDTQYYIHLVQTTTVDSLVYTSPPATTFPEVVDPPVIHSAIMTATGQTTADAVFNTNTPSGTGYWYISQSAVAPAIATIKSGAGADSHAALPISSTGFVAYSPTDLVANTTYYSHNVHESTDGDSNVLSSSAATTDPLAAPVLSSPTATALGSNRLNISVTTDSGDGTLYWYVSQSATPPSSADLKAGTGADDSGSLTVVSPGVKSATANGLQPETLYYVHFIQDNGSDSNIVSSAGVTTGAQGSVNPNSTLNDAILFVTGGPTQSSGLMSYYRAGGATGETLNELEYNYAASRVLGTPPVTLNDVWFTYLRQLGYQGTMNDMLLQYWLSGGDV